jgi:DNA-binding PadR family transcriptional regulator
MTKAELAILGLIAEKPRYGYEIEGVIEARGMRDWTEIGFSSIYYVLRKLEDKGLVASKLEKPSGRGPARKVFRVTKEGQQAWNEETLKTLSTLERAPTPFLLGMSALPAFPPEEAIQALREYRNKLIEHRNALKQRWMAQAAAQPLPYFVDAMFDYSVTLTEAEMAWVSKLIQQIQANANRR